MTSSALITNPWVPGTGHLTPPSNYLYFQQYSRLSSVTIFVFYNIPASRANFPHRSFVFNNIRASFVHF